MHFQVERRAQRGGIVSSTPSSPQPRQQHRAIVAEKKEADIATSTNSSPLSVSTIMKRVLVADDPVVEAEKLLTEAVNQQHGGV